MEEEKKPSLADIDPIFADAIRRKEEREVQENAMKGAAWELFKKDVSESGMPEADQKRVIQHALAYAAQNPNTPPPTWTGTKIPQSSLAFRRAVNQLPPIGMSAETAQAIAPYAGAAIGYKMNPVLESLAERYQQAAQPSMAKAAAQSAAQAAPGFGQNLPPAPQAAPSRGYGTFNYAVSQGLGDIEAAKALDMTKQEGGVHDLLTQRREAMNKIQNLFPSETYAERPSGLMVPGEGVGAGPKASYVQRPVGGLSQIPTRVPVPPVTPAEVSPLAKVQQLFGKIGQTGAAMLQDVLKSRLVGGLAGAGTAYETFNALKNLYEGNTEESALSGIGALGGGISMIPTAPTRFGGAALSSIPYIYRRMKEVPVEQSQKALMSVDPMGNPIP